MVPTSWPPIDCQAFWPSRIVSPSKSRWPSEATTSEGIGGALWSTLTPTPPNTAKETVNTSPRAIQSLLYVIDEHLSLCTGNGPGPCKCDQKIYGKARYRGHFSDCRYRQPPPRRSSQPLVGQNLGAHTQQASDRQQGQACGHQFTAEQQPHS